ncbi:MAG: FG-GAP-like repeat-containing protein [Myxococcales bacterium]
MTREPSAALVTPRPFDFRIPIAVLVIAVICANFWIGSRYPSLQGKASADPNEALSTPLGFERFFPEPPQQQVLRHIGWTALEWGITNRQGMTFGLLLAAAMLTLLPLLRRTSGGKLAGAVRGMLVGAPLGVCVNCAAPIAQGMLDGGSRVETALAALFASPTFNVIVLGIVFSIFPWYLAILKVVASLIVVLAIAPWLASLAERPGWTRPAQRAPPLPGLGLFRKLENALRMPELSAGPAADRPRGFLRALWWFVVNYPRNLLRTLLVALPLMLLAGVFGAVLVEILPWNALNHLGRIDGMLAAGGVLVIATVFGVLLPVPIAFDVIVCSVLLNAGMPVSIVGALLVTLGTYSIYALSILGTTLSWRIAGVAAAAVFGVGLASGAAAGVVDRWNDLYQSGQAALLASRPAPESARVVLPVGRSAAELRNLAPPLPAAQKVASGAGAELWFTPFERAGKAAGQAQFARVDGPLLGFKRLPLPRLYQTMQPGPMHLGPLAAGDVKDDGWPDLAVGTSYGVFLYVNIGGRFELQQIDFPEMRDWPICDVALVDLDGDGKPDLYFSAWMHGAHILWNRGGEFSAAAHTELPRATEVCAASTAFADVDRDGLVDVVTGGATFESWYFYPAPAVNRLWHNRGGGRFEPETLPGPEGDTLSLLFTDLDGDGWPDLLVGNDFDEPDRIFMNRGGKLVPVKKDQSPLPYSGMTTMSFDTADLANDGKRELYVGQIAMGKMGELPKKLAPPVASCGIYSDMADISRCDLLARFQAAVARGRDNWTIELCRELPDPADQRDCAVTAYYWTRILLRLPASGADKAEVLRECDKIPKDFNAMHDVCEAMAQSTMDYNQSHKTLTDEIPSVAHNNLLFVPEGKMYRDATSEWGAGYGGWTWNAKFADLDNDGWQDLFIAQGTRLRLYNPSNVFYRNQRGSKLLDSTREAGLVDHLPGASFVFLDYDLDGDLDIVTSPFALAPVVWRNDAPAGAGFEVQLDDRRSRNRFGIGAKVEIAAPDGRRQMRDVKASGGNQSHDLLVARFGLGDWPSVASITVSWPDGQATRLEGGFGAGRYRFARLAQ